MNNRNVLLRVWTGALCLVPVLVSLAGCGGGEGSAGIAPSGASHSYRAAGVTNGNAVLQRVAKLTLKPGEGSLYSSVIDPAKGYAYFSTSGSVHPGYIIKVALGAGNAAPVEVGSLQLPAGQEGMVTSVIDTVHGYAYFANLASPARIFKVALGSGNAPPLLVGSIALNTGEGSVINSTIDVARGYAYFACGPTPCKIVKVALGQGNALPTRVSATDLPSGTRLPVRLTIDPANGYLYALTSNNALPNQLLKFSVGAGNAAPTQVSSLTFPAGEGNFGYMEIDSSAGYAYIVGDTNPGGVFGNTAPGTIVKVRLNPGGMAPTRIGSLTVPQKYFSAGGLDPNTHYLYLGNDLTFPASNVLQIATGQGDSLPTLVNTLQLQPGTQSYTFATRPIPADAVLAGEVYIRSGAIDPAAGYLYFGTDTRAGQVIKVAIPAR